MLAAQNTSLRHKAFISFPSMGCRAQVIAINFTKVLVVPQELTVSTLPPQAARLCREG